MKLAEAMMIIEQQPREPGYRVSYEEREGCLLATRHFPDHTERPIRTLEEAQSLAERFAEKCGDRYINVHVIRADNFAPVEAMT